jgi:hypothetical protein
VEKINATVSGEEFIEGEEFARTPPLSSGMAPEALRELLVRYSGPGILATFAFPSLWNDLRASASQAKRVVNNAPGMCQGIFRFPNQNGSWHGQESAGKKSGNKSQLIGLQYGANVDENLSWHFSPKAGQVEIRKSEL